MAQSPARMAQSRVVAAWQQARASSMAPAAAPMVPRVGSSSASPSLRAASVGPSGAPPAAAEAPAESAAPHSAGWSYGALAVPAVGAAVRAAHLVVPGAAAGSLGLRVAAENPGPMPGPAIPSIPSPKSRSKQSPVNACHPSEAVKQSGSQQSQNISHDCHACRGLPRQPLNAERLNDHPPDNASATGHGWSRQSLSDRLRPIWSRRAV